MTIDNFPAFAALVAKGFRAVATADRAFRTAADGRHLSQAYLEAFPEGTNPLFRERTEHDCNCCHQFLRNAGNAVAVSADGHVVTVWDDAARAAPEPYATVATVLRAAVLSEPIADLFVVGPQFKSGFGAEKTRSAAPQGGGVEVWNHLYTGPLPASCVHRQPDTARGDYRTSVAVFERALAELTTDAVDTVADLIADNNLYRGAEFRDMVTAFAVAQRQHAAAGNKNAYVWRAAATVPTRFRNTAIGTLVTDLSQGADLESAVGRYDAKMAPANYRRPTALVSRAQIAKAMETITELGLEPALERRFARLDDVSVNDVLWVNNDVAPLMRDGGGIADVLMDAVDAQSNDVVDVSKLRTEDIDIDTFMSDVLPEATAMEVLFSGEHVGNLVSLTAPVHQEPARLFAWDNDFAWSYAGNVADSIKERVKRAGGRVDDVALRTSLSWFNADDLDIRVHTPRGELIYFGHRRGRCGGELDVDMNVRPYGDDFSRQAVENVAWTSNPPNGVYRVSVHNYTKREDEDVGFVIEVEDGGRLSHYRYDRKVRHNEEVPVVDLTVRDGVVVSATAHVGIVASQASREKWGLKTEMFVKVNAVTLSPNYWGDNAVGNKHHIFVIDGAENDEPTRGIYNEYLNKALAKHRKVFELIGDKTKCQPTDGQLSGLGFSSTKNDTVVVRVSQGRKQRLFNVKIGA